MPHLAIQATIDALQVPAMIVSTRANIMAVNQRAHDEVTPHFMKGASYVAIMKEMGWDRDGLSFSAVVLQDAVEACRCHNINMHTLFVVTSELDPIGGWPPSVFITMHSRPKTEDRALSLHRRDRRAVEVGILLDRARTDLSMMYDMLQATHHGVEQAIAVWCDRIKEIEPTLPVE